jgi:hypothetical protein
MADGLGVGVLVGRGENDWKVLKLSSFQKKIYQFSFHFIEKKMISFFVFLFVVVLPHVFGSHTLVYSGKVCVGSSSGFNQGVLFANPQLCGDACLTLAGGPYSFFMYHTSSDPTPGLCTCSKVCSSTGNWAGIDTYSIDPTTKTPSATPTVTPSLAPKPTASPTAPPSATRRQRNRLLVQLLALPLFQQ